MILNRKHIIKETHQRRLLLSKLFISLYVIQSDEYQYGCSIRQSHRIMVFDGKTVAQATEFPIRQPYVKTGI